MNIFLFVIFSFFVGSIHADFGILQQIPTTNIYPSTRQLSIQINQTVNQPSFPAFINIYNAISNTTIYLIDVHLNATDVIYLNQTLTFPIPGFNITTEIYVTFDAGVLFSGSLMNSTARIDRQFWYLTVISDAETTNAPFTTDNISTGTTYSGTIGSSMSYSDTSTMAVTTMSVSISQITQNVTEKMPTGESPPTRSAQIGMGLGITFISVLIIGEIVYFKFCYRGTGRSGSYFT